MTGYQGDPDLITIPAAARKYLSVTPRTAYEWARTGKFPGGAAMKIGGSWRVSVPRLLRFLHGEAVAS